MDNSRMFSATHGLNVTKTLLSAKTAPSRKTACGSSFAQTLVSVTTRKTTITVTKTTTEMTMAEYQEYIYEKISNLPVHPTQANRSASVFISAEGFAEMKANSEYEDWVIGKLEEDFAISNPLCPRYGSYVVYQFGAKKSDYHGDSWYPAFQGGRTGRSRLPREERRRFLVEPPQANKGTVQGIRRTLFAAEKGDADGKPARPQDAADGARQIRRSSVRHRRRPPGVPAALGNRWYGHGTINLSVVVK